MTDAMRRDATRTQWSATCRTRELTACPENLGRRILSYMGQFENPNDPEINDGLEEKSSGPLVFRPCFRGF